MDLRQQFIHRLGKEKLTSDDTALLVGVLGEKTTEDTSANDFGLVVSAAADEQLKLALACIQSPTEVTPREKLLCYARRISSTSNVIFLAGVLGLKTSGNAQAALGCAIATAPDERIGDALAYFEDPKPKESLVRAGTAHGEHDIDRPEQGRAKFLENFKNCLTSQLHHACNGGQSDDVEQILMYANVDPAKLEFQSAAQVLPAIRDLLLRDGRLSPATKLQFEAVATDRCMLCSAVSKNLPVEIYYALETSCNNCQSFDDNFQSICENGQIELVRRFLEHERCDPSTLKFVWADALPRETRDLLFADGRLSPGTKQLFVEAAVRNLLCEAGLKPKAACDPTRKNHKYVKWAFGSGNVELVKLLLQDERVDVKKYAKELVDCVIEAEDTEILGILLRDPRINERAGEVKDSTARIATMFAHLSNK